MTSDTLAPQSRRVLRAAAVSFGLVLGSIAAPAFAAPPDGGPWEPQDNGPLLETLLFLLGVPVLVFVVLAVLVYLPSMIHRQSAEPALAFRDRAEWFGGPRRGVDSTQSAGSTSATSATTGEETGGASGRW
jgi:hypothetical protein